MNTVPGEKIGKLLEQWADEDVYDDDDIKKYTTEFALSL